MPRLKPKEKTIKQLYAKSGNQCAFPDCTQQICMDGNSENISAVCHIEAAEEGGQRYNPKLSDEERRSYDNLIVLCPNHHKITDDVVQHPVEVLKKMKTDHEYKITQNMVEREPQIFFIIINALANVDWESKPQSESIESFSIEKKIKFNNIVRWRPYIDEYKEYQGKIDSVYNELECSGNSFKKGKLLRLISHAYLEIKGEWMEKNPKIGELQIIQESADSILDNVEERLIAEVENHNDDIAIAMPIIMVDAFMRCKILEKPPSSERL